MVLPSNNTVEESLMTVVVRRLTRNKYTGEFTETVFEPKRL
jgi:hypothetical protein